MERSERATCACSDCGDTVVGRIDTTTPFEVFNLGIDDYCTVTESTGWISGSTLASKPQFEYTGGDHGWIGDNPFIYLGNRAGARAAGWAPSFTIREAVNSTVDYLLAEPWLLDATA